MKTTNRLTFPLLCAAALAFASCSKDDTSLPEQGRVLTITVAVDGYDNGAAALKSTAYKAGSRATDTGYATTFDAGDAIGIYVYEGSTLKLTNKKWVLDTDGTTWKPATAADNIYYGSTTHTLRAYYPYDANAAALPTAATFAVQTDQSTAAGYRASDLLSSADAAWNGTALPVALSFSHAMALVEAHPLNGAPMTSVTMQGVSLTQGGTAGNITMFDAGDGVWRAAVPAQTFASGSQIVFDYGAVGTYAYTVSGSATAATARKFTVTTLPAAVGDYYYSDGTYSTALNATKTAIGVVFWKDPADPAHGKIVSLDEEKTDQGAGRYGVAWGPFPSTTTASNMTDGLSNMAAIAAAIVSSNGAWTWSSFPAFNWVHGKNPASTTYASGNKGKWYLPAKDELSTLYTAYNTNRVTFNSYLTGAGGTALESSTLPFYWSSSQAHDDNAWNVSFGYGNTSSTIKSRQLSVRGVLAF